MQKQTVPILCFGCSNRYECHQKAEDLSYIIDFCTDPGVYNFTRFRNIILSDACSTKRSKLEIPMEKKDWKSVLESFANSSDQLARNVKISNYSVTEHATYYLKNESNRN
jgi:hypothetical protein